MTEVLKAHPALTGESPSGKANRHSCTNFKKGSCQRRDICDYWQVPECTTFHISRTMQVRRQVCIQTHIAKPADETRYPVSIAIHIPSNDERQMQLRKIQSDSKTQFSDGDLIITRTSMFSKERTWDPHMESSRPHLKISDIQMLHWTLSMEEKTLDFTQERVQSFRFVF